MKKQWELNDYLVVAFIILLIIGNVYSCSRTSEKAQQAEIEAAYSEGYAQGYSDCENGLPYDEDR